MRSVGSGLKRADVVVRRLWPQETPLYREHLQRLDHEGRRLRFGQAIGDAWIAEHAAREVEPGTVLEGAFVEGVLRGVGELRPFGPAARDKAELAFSVERDFRRQGLGGLLLDRLVLVSKNDGLHILQMTCLRENRAMQKLARRYGGRLATSPGEVDGIILTPAPTPFSLAREVMLEQSNMVSALLGAITDRGGTPRAA
nr:GNAT family N-acetyltransferase [Acuticoccus kalidii]